MMIQTIRTFIQNEKLYAWLLISALFMQSFFLLFGQERDSVPSPAVELLKAAQEEVHNTEDKKKLFDELFSEDRQLALVFFLVVICIFFLGGAGFVLSIICCVRLSFAKPLIQKVLQHDEPVPWSIAEVFKVMILFYFWSLVLGIVFGFAHEYLLGGNRENLLILVHTLVIDCAVLCFVIYFVRFKFNSPVTTIGLSRNTIFRDIFFGFSSYAVVLPVLILIIALLSYVVSLVSYEPAPHPLVDIFVVEDRQNPFVIYLSVILACTVGPIIEEIFFRGFCYTTIKKYIGVNGAMVISAAFFSAVHYSAFAFLPVFALGMILAYLYEKRGTLMPSITLHIVHNSLFIGYFFIIKRILLDRV